MQTKPESSKKARVGGRSARVLEQVAQAAANELRESGFIGFSVSRVAERAGVHTATIYRRWATSAELIAFAAERLAKQLMPAPDTGSLAGDLRARLINLRSFLNSADGEMLVAISFASGSAPELAEMKRSYWSRRTADRDSMFARAHLRGELSRREDLEDLIEMAIGPLYVRKFISLRAIDDEFIDRVVERSLSSFLR